jgi:hypothetical protein
MSPRKRRIVPYLTLAAAALVLLTAPSALAQGPPCTYGPEGG